MISYSRYPRLKFLVSLSVLLGAGYQAALGDEPIETLAPGAKAPAWSDLSGTDGKKHSLQELSEPSVIVVVFHSNICPFSEDYESRVNAIAKEFAPKGVAVVAINSGTEDDENLAAMTQRAKERGYAFPYLRDESQRTGKSFGAKVTPQVFVLDKSRTIRYVGAVDDHRNPEKVTKHHLRNAVVALLEGKEPPVMKTKAAGCSIQYDE